MRTSLYIVILLLLVLAGVTLRTYDITADHPGFFAGGVQDFTTDAAYLTLYAKSAVQQGVWDLYDFEPWSAFKVSLVSGVSYLMFQVFGVSRATAASSGAVLQICGLMFFLIGCAKYLNRNTLLLLAVLVSTNFLLVLYARVPFSENALMFLTGLVFLVYCYWSETTPGRVAVGVLVALAAMLGKVFGVLLIGGPLLYWALTERNKLVRNSLQSILPAIGTALLFSAFFHGEGGLLGFIFELGVGEHGAPHGFSSPLGFFESLISVTSNGLHRYAPALSAFAYLALLVALAGKLKPDGSEKIFYFMVGWFTAWLIVLSPFNYHPIRYFLVLIVPMASIIAIVVSRLRLGDYVLHRSWNWWRIALLLLLNWYVSYVLAREILHSTFETTVVYRTVWQVLPIGVALSGLILVVARVYRKKFTLSMTPLVPVMLVVLVAATDLWQFGVWMNGRGHMIEQAADDIADLLGGGAVLAGQYGPTLASNSPHGSLRMFLRDDYPAFRRQLAQYPVTHVAVGYGDYSRPPASTDLFQNSQEITTFYLRDNKVRVFRVNHISGNKDALRYQQSGFEHARDLINESRFAEAEQSLRDFIQVHPRNKAAMIELYYTLALSGKLTEAEPIVDSLCEHFSDDFTVSLMAAIFYKSMAALTARSDLRARSEMYLAEATKRRSEQADNVKKIYDAFQPTDRIIR